MKRSYVPSLSPLCLYIHSFTTISHLFTISLFLLTLFRAFVGRLGGSKFVPFYRSEDIAQRSPFRKVTPDEVPLEGWRKSADKAAQITACSASVMGERSKSCHPKKPARVLLHTVLNSCCLAHWLILAPGSQLPLTVAEQRFTNAGRAQLSPILLPPAFHFSCNSKLNDISRTHLNSPIFPWFFTNL